MTRLPPRLALAVRSYGWAVVAVVVAVGLVAAGVGASGLASPERTTVTDHTEQQTTSLDVASTATVTENATLFTPGTTLSDQAYPVAGAPNLTVVVETEASESTSLHYDHSLALRYAITRDEEVVWSETEPVATANGTVETGARTNATVSIPAVRDRLAELGAAAGSRARVSVTLVVSSAYETDRYQGQFTRKINLDIGDRWYSLASVDASREHSTPEHRRIRVAAANRDDRRLAIAGGALAVVGLLGAVGRYRFDPGDDADLRHRLHQRRYDDWISNGHLPSSFERRVVTMASLADLAELAIDRQRRIVFDDSQQAYAVFDADVVYYYDDFWTDHDPLDDD